MKTFKGTARRSRLGLALIVGLLLTLAVPLVLPAAAPVAAAQTQPTATVTAPRLSIRIGPGASYSRITTVGQGARVTLLGRDSASAWAKVALANGVQGWATTFYLDTGGALSSVPVLVRVQPQVRVEPPRLNVRLGPGINYPVMTSLPSGEVVNVTARSADSRWLYVNFGGNSLGWIGSGEITPKITLHWLPVTDAAGRVGPGVAPVPGGIPLPGGLTGVGRAGYPPIRVNTADSNDHGIITHLEAGETVQLLGRNAAATWLYIFFRGDTLGWVDAADIVTSVNIAALPVVPPPDMPVGEDQVPPSTLPTVTPPATPTGQTATVTAARLNVRAGAGPGFSVIDVVTRGQVLPLLGRDSLGAWLQVRTPAGRTGWISALYANESGSVARVPVETSYNATALVITGALNVRSGPGPQYPRVTTVYQNDYITLTGRIPSSTWLKVVANGVEGWVDASFIRTAYPVQTLPVFRASQGDF